MVKALNKAAAYNIYDMRRIENILKNEAEDMLPEREYPWQLKPDNPKFLRDKLSFNHYRKE